MSASSPKAFNGPARITNFVDYRGRCIKGQQNHISLLRNDLTDQKTSGNYIFQKNFKIRYVLFAFNEYFNCDNISDFNQK